MAEEGGGAEEQAVVGAEDMEGQIVVAGAAYEEEETDGGRGGGVGAAGDMEGQIVVAGAAYEEEDTDGGRGGGGGAAGDEESGRGEDQFIFIPPPGFRFRPSDDELIRYYLLPKLQGRGYTPNRAIIEHNVYQCHPDELVGKYRDRGEGKSFYFLSPRVRRYDNGNRPRRDTEDGRGRWKVSTGKMDKEEKKVAGDGTTRYCMSVLNYFESPRGGGRKSEWLMRELTVPRYEIKLPKDGGPGGKTLDRYVMCKIYLKDDKGDDEDEAGPSSASPQNGPVEGEEGATAELPKLSKKLAVKRPADDQQLRNAAAAARKRAHHSSKCLKIEPPPPPQGNGMEAPFSTPGCSYYGGSGQPMPMGYHAGTPMPRPMLAYNNGQVHVPRQQVAYNGPVPVMARQPAAYNGKMQVRQQQVAFNGQMTMMTRPSCPAGQAVNPQMQKQLKTDEMLEKRVLQQNLEEHLRMQSFTQQQQQQQVMAFTRQQQQLAMASTHQQRQAMAFMMRQQQQWRMSFMLHQQKQQQPYLGGANANYHQHAGVMAMAPHFSIDEAVRGYERSRAVLPATSGSPGEAAAVTADGSPVSTVESVEGNEQGNNGGCSNHGREEESAVVKVSPGGVTAPASASASAVGDGPQHA